MVQPETIVDSVSFQPDFSSDRLGYNPELGFLEVDEKLIAFGSIRMLGFGVPITRSGGIDTRQTVQPITEFQQLPAEARTISLQGKGVGPRLYNVPPAVQGLPSESDIVGAYTVDLDTSPDRLLDLREWSGGPIRQIARHAGRSVMAKATSLEAVVDKIHGFYGDADAVLLKQPPLPSIRQMLRKARNPEDVAAEFIIVRNPHILLTKVGTVQAVN